MLGTLKVGPNVWPPVIPTANFRHKEGGTPDFPEGEYKCEVIGGFYDYETGQIIHVALVEQEDIDRLMALGAEENRLMTHLIDRDGAIYKQNWFPEEPICVNCNDQGCDYCGPVE